MNIPTLNTLPIPLPLQPHSRREPPTRHHIHTVLITPLTNPNPTNLNIVNHFSQKIKQRTLSRRPNSTHHANPQWQHPTPQTNQMNTPTLNTLPIPLPSNPILRRGAPTRHHIHTATVLSVTHQLHPSTTNNPSPPSDLPLWPPTRQPYSSETLAFTATTTHYAPSRLTPSH